MKIKFFGFSLIFFAMFSFVSCENIGKKITCKPENFKEQVSRLESGGTYNVIVTGTISNSKRFLIDLSAALNQDKTVKVHLDLSGTEGLKTFASGAENLLGVSLPSSIIKLEISSFNGKNIEYVDFPKGNKIFSVENKNVIYEHNALLAVLQTAKELNIREGTEIIYARVINRLKNLENITFPSTLTTLEADNFYDCPKLVSVNLSKIKISELHNLFSNCPNLETVNLENSQIKAIKSCFYNCPKIQVKWSETLEEINNSFFHLGFTAIVLPNSLKIIRNSFKNCSNLKKIDFGNSLELLIAGLESCPELKAISLPASLKRLTCFDGGGIKTEWKFDIELEDKSDWYYMTEVREKTVGMSYIRLYETAVDKEILYSQEKLGNFVNNERAKSGCYGTGNDVMELESGVVYGSIWKKGLYFLK